MTNFLFNDMLMVCSGDVFKVVVGGREFGDKQICADVCFSVYERMKHGPRRSRAKSHVTRQPANDTDGWRRGHVEREGRTFAVADLTYTFKLDAAPDYILCCRRRYLTVQLSIWSYPGCRPYLSGF